jgi:peptide/nickel transport system permease protein
MPEAPEVREQRALPDDASASSPGGGGYGAQPHGVTEQTLQPGAVAVAPIPAVGADDAPLGKKGWGWGFWLAVAWIVVLGVVLLLVPVLPLDDPDDPSASLFAGVNKEGFLFGSDELGRDLFSRVLWGGRVSLAIGIVSLVLGFILGGFIGITAGFFRGRYEKLVMAMVDVMLSFPALILALALLRLLSDPGTLEGSFGKVVTVLTVLAIPSLARITRANTLVYSQREFVLAARSLGAKPWRILVKEILPNVLPSMLSFSFVALAILVVAEGALAFLGLSVEAPTVTWGKLIELGRGDLDKAPNLALIPCAFLFITLLALNLVGDKLQSRFSVREANV